MENNNVPEVPSYLKPISEAIIRYARGQASYKDFSTELEKWRETQQEALAER